MGGVACAAGRGSLLAHWPEGRKGRGLPRGGRGLCFAGLPGLRAGAGGPGCARPRAGRAGEGMALSWCFPEAFPALPILLRRVARGGVAVQGPPQRAGRGWPGSPRRAAAHGPGGGAGRAMSPCVPVCPPAPGVRSGRSPCVLGSARRAPSGQGQAGPELLGLALSERCPESSQCGVQRLCYGAGLPSWAWVGEERRENRQEPINAYK